MGMIDFDVMTGKVEGGHIFSPARIDGGENKPVVWFTTPMTDYILFTLGEMPPNYGGNFKAKIKYSMLVDATGETIVWYVQVAAVTPGDPVDIQAKAFDAENRSDPVGDVVPGTLRSMKSVEIDLVNNDNLEAGDILYLLLLRQSTSVADTAIGPAGLHAFTITWVDV